MANGRPRSLNKRALAATFAASTLGVALGLAPASTASERTAAPALHQGNSEQPPIGPGASRGAQKPSVATAAAAGSGYEVTFQANTGNLWTVGTAGSGPWPLGLMRNTTSSIASLAGGGQEEAFQANTGNLWTVGNAGNGAWPLGMMPGTSPSITGLAGGGYEVAFQANTGNLWTVGTAGNGAWPLGMMPGTSPAIAALPGGGYEVAFQANTGNLWTVGTAGNGAWPLGMMPGTSPAIAALPSGGYEVAFQANTGNLWTVGTAGNGAWPLGMMRGTSPSISAVTGGYEVAFQANTGNLWTVGTAGNGAWPLGLMPGTSPSITGLPSGGYEVAFQANTGNLWTVGTAGNSAWPLGMMSGSGPTITPAGPAAAQAPLVAAPPPPPQQDNNYAFEVTNGAGSPARWNPCESVHYVVVPSGAPAGWQNDISNDISQAASATGLSFVSDGTAGSAPSSYNGIVISWTPQLSGGDTVGLTTYSYYNVSSYTPQIVSAKIQLLSSLRGGGGSTGEQPVLLHELGHALGLGHVNAAEVMNPVDQGYSSYHAGDLNGLSRLGASQGGCSTFYS